MVFQLEGLPEFQALQVDVSYIHVHLAQNLPFARGGKKKQHSLLAAYRTFAARSVQSPAPLLSHSRR